MIDLPLLLAFVVAASVLTITPGVDTAMVIRAATAEGRRTAAMAALGIGLGCLAWGAAVVLGLGALLRASELAYTIVRISGAAYLMWLGVKLLLKPRTAMVPGGAGARVSSGRDAFRNGFLTNLLNPKVGVFYITFLPQFVPAGASVAAWSFVLASVHVLLTLLWFAVLIAAADRLGRILRQPRTLATLDRLTGLVFVGFGLKLASSSSR